MSEPWLLEHLAWLAKKAAELADEVVNARKDWLSATDPQRKEGLKRMYEDLKEMEKRLQSNWAVLKEGLSGSGEYTYCSLWPRLGINTCATPLLLKLGITWVSCCSSRWIVA